MNVSIVGYIVDVDYGLLVGLRKEGVGGERRGSDHAWHFRAKVIVGRTNTTFGHQPWSHCFEVRGLFVVTPQ